MTIYQAYYYKIRAWVQYEYRNGKYIIISVKQKEPTKPFKGVPKRSISVFKLSFDPKNIWSSH